MRNKLILHCAGVLSLVACLVIAASASDASTTNVALSITGGAVAGYTAAQADQELPVSFTMTNHSRTTSVSVDFFFTLTNATADATDYVCPTVGIRVLINPDTPACEPGFLGAGKSTSAAILVTPTISSGTVTMKACANDENNNPDPNRHNNCKTINIRIE